MEKQSNFKASFRLFCAIVWMNSIGLVIDIIAALSCLGTKISEDQKEICIDELELNLIKLFVLAGSIMLLVFYFSHSKWQIIIGISLLVLSLLGGLKRFAINILNGFHGD
jgi:hypothetical protein